MTVAGGMDYDTYASDEMSLRDYWALARRRKWYIIVPVLFAVGFSLASSLSTTPMYRAKTDVLVEAAPVPGAVQSETAMLERNLNNELLRAEGPTMQAEARKEVGDEPTLSVALAQDKNADLLVFTAESRSARRAAEAANAYANTFVTRRQAELVSGFQKQLEAEQQNLDAADETLSGLDPDSSAAEEQRQLMADSRSTISDLRTAIQLAEQSGATVVNVAEVPPSPFSPRPVRSAILAVMLGLFIGLASAFVRDLTDNHIRTPEGLEKATGRPTSAVVPRLRGWKKSETHVIVLEDATSPQAEAYRSLRARIQFRRVDRQIRSIMITSARPGEGKTTTSANLAVAFAAAGENTVLVDLDMRRPRIHKFFPMSNDHGMSTVLVGGDLSTAIQQSATVPNLSIVPAGPATSDSSEILHDDVLEEVLGELKERFDIVVVDTPPVLAVADPLTISHYCDGTLLVVSASGTDKRDAERASQQLADMDARVIGAVLNNYSAAATGYSYSYAYSDYTPSVAKSDHAPAPARQPGLGEHAADLSRRERRRLAKQQKDGAPALNQAGTFSVEAHNVPPTPSVKNELDVDVVAFQAPLAGEADTEPDVTVSEISLSDSTSEIGLTASQYHIPPVDPPIDSLQSSRIAESAVDDKSRAAESTVPLDDPSAAMLERLERLERLEVEHAANNGDRAHNDGDYGFDDDDSDEVEVMTAAQFQDYLRSELRRAREEHIAEAGPKSTSVQTIKVVVLADEDDPDTAESSTARRPNDRHKGVEPSKSADRSRRGR